MSMEPPVLSKIGRRNFILARNFTIKTPATPSGREHSLDPVGGGFRGGGASWVSVESEAGDIVVLDITSEVRRVMRQSGGDGQQATLMIVRSFAALRMTDMATEYYSLGNSMRRSLNAAPR